MEGLLAAGDLPRARARLGHLCSRSATGLNAGELARATVESVAENTSDAGVAPLLWGGAFGLTGLAGYRAVKLRIGDTVRRPARSSPQAPPPRDAPSPGTAAGRARGSHRQARRPR